MNKNKKKRSQGRTDGVIGRLFARTKIPAHVTEEQDWYLDTPDVRLTRVFTIVLILHVVAVGGILAFKMIEKASAPGSTLADNISKTTAAPVVKQEAKEPATASAASAPALVEAPMPLILAETEDEPVVLDHPSASGYREYRVVIGDTVAGVARKMNVNEGELRELNQLGARDSLPSGKWLLVPSEEAASAPEPAPAVEIADSPPKPEVKKADPPKDTPSIARLNKTETKVTENPPVKEPAKKPSDSYQVQKGDTPYGIARRFGVDLKSLMAANGLNRPENLRAGQTVVIPKN